MIEKIICGILAIGAINRVLPAVEKQIKRVMITIVPNAASYGT